MRYRRVTILIEVNFRTALLLEDSLNAGAIAALLDEWMAEQGLDGSVRVDDTSDDELKTSALIKRHLRDAWREFVAWLRPAQTQKGGAE